ncbi:SDR family oxidoreductase [Streptomyces ziwulingensis]
MLTAVTGATGFLGSHLLSELLASGRDVVALVRDEPNTALRRLRTATQATRVTPLEDFTRRVHAVRYDLLHPTLGLDPTTHAGLAASIDEIWHCAASIDMLGLPHELHRTNVMGTRNVLELARAAGPSTRVRHISTAYVAGARLNGTVYEDDLDESHGFLTPYEASKYQAELAVHSWADQYRHPVTVLRPSVLVSDRPIAPGAPSHPFTDIGAKLALLDDEENIDALVAMTGGDSLNLRLQGDPEAGVNVVQVEHAAAAMVRIGRHRSAELISTFHVVHPHETTVGMITAALQACCPRLKVEFTKDPPHHDPVERLALDAVAGISRYTHLRRRYDRSRFLDAVGPWHEPEDIDQNYLRRSFAVPRPRPLAYG